MDTGIKDEAATNNKMYHTYCNSTTTTSAAPSQTTTAASLDSAQSSKIPTIVGAVIGSVVALVVATAVARFLWRKRQRRIIPISLDIDSSYAPEGTLISPYTVPGEYLVALSVRVRITMFRSHQIRHQGTKVHTG
jgi:hypothetical protein